MQGKKMTKNASVNYYPIFNKQISLSIAILMRMLEYGRISVITFPFTAILYSKLVNQMSKDSSIPVLPSLNLALLDNRIPPKQTTGLKQRIVSRFTLTDILEMPPIIEEFTDRLSTERSNISIAQMRTLRVLKINALKEMSEDECLRRYTKDPFFRKKVQSEVRSLSKCCSLVHLPTVPLEDSPLQIQKTTRLIQDETTYRKIKENESVQNLASKSKLEHVMSQVQLRTTKAGNKQN